MSIEKENEENAEKLAHIRRIYKIIGLLGMLMYFLGWGFGIFSGTLHMIFAFLGNFCFLISILIAFRTWNRHESNRRSSDDII